MKTIEQVREYCEKRIDDCYVILASDANIVFKMGPQHEQYALQQLLNFINQEDEDNAPKTD